MDFVSDALFNGKKFKALTLVDNQTRECLAIVDGQSLTGACVAEALSDVIASGRELPKRIQTYNGPEFISDVLPQSRQQLIRKFGYVDIFKLLCKQSWRGVRQR